MRTRIDSSRSHWPACLAAAALLAAGPAWAQSGPPRDEPELAAQLGNLLLVGIEGHELGPESATEALICEVRVGGVILFDRSPGQGTGSRNIRSPDQLRSLTQSLQAVARRCGNAPLLIAADVEGGSVNRLKPSYGFPAFPSAAALGAESDRARTRARARELGELLRSVGINWDLAPVVDLALDPASPAIGRYGRSFSDDPEIVALQAEAFVEGLNDAGVLHSLKHFPGMGSSAIDPHLAPADVTDSADPVRELIPFARLIASGRIRSISTAHVTNRRLDPDQAATFSHRILTDLLRTRLRYTGLILGEDLLMGAVLQTRSLEEAGVGAVAAGVDMLTLSSDRMDDGSSASRRIVRALAGAVARGEVSRGRIADAWSRVAELRRALTAHPSAQPEPAAAPESAAPRAQRRSDSPAD